MLNLVDGNASGSVRGIHTATGYTMGVDALALGTNTVASGAGAVAEGANTQATGDYAHAEGLSTLASGESAHAEGTLTTASQFQAHAEGFQTLAAGYASHAEGASAAAEGNVSHAEGDHTQAIGDNSHAEGYNTQANGPNSHAQGNSTQANGHTAFAQGHETIADGHNSYAGGYNTHAVGGNAHAEGDNTLANGANSHTEGDSTQANGNATHAQGHLSQANGHNSHAEGFNTRAQGNNSHAEGTSTQALGGNSHTHGDGTIAAANNQTAIGLFNTESLADVFIIGNGSGDTARSNAFRVSFGGDTYCAGSFYPGGADYAEMFEWQDGNPENEDRRGLFVTLQGEFIRPATAEDPYILGVVSCAPSVAGDSQSEGWKDRVLRDVWGAVLYETKEGVSLPKRNPRYDPSLAYVPRAQRKEWAAVGLLGKLIVRDDGSCQPGGYCVPGNSGATAAPQGYRVMKRVDAGKVMICLK